MYLLLINLSLIMSLVLMINSFSLSGSFKNKYNINDKSFAQNKNYTNSTNGETRTEKQIMEYSTNSSKSITKNKCQSIFKIIEEMEELFDETKEKDICCEYLNIKFKNENCFGKFDVKQVLFFIEKCSKYIITDNKCEIYNGISLISKISIGIITSCVIILLLYILKSVNKLENIFNYLKI